MPEYRPGVGGGGGGVQVGSDIDRCIMEINIIP